MDQEYSKRFYGFFAPAYDWVFGRALEEGRRQAASLVRTGEDVLEVGVGTGLSLRYYPADSRVVGVDICAKMLRRARWRAFVEGDGRQIDLRYMDAMSLDFPDESFDVVVAPYVITTVGDPLRLCFQMRRVCRPKGRVIVVSNALESGLYGAIKSMLSPLMEKVGFVTDLDVRNVLRGTGLQVMEERRVNWFGMHKLFVAGKESK